MSYVYRYLDEENKVLYIGSTKRNIAHRINEHRNEEYYRLSKIIEYSEVEENIHNDYENKLIDTVRPQFNKLINNIHYKNVDVKNLNWVKYDDAIPLLKDNSKRGKVPSKNNYIIIKDFLLLNNTTVEESCVKKLNSFSPHQRDLCSKTFERDVAILYLLLEKNITPNKCESLNVSDLDMITLSDKGSEFIQKYLATRKIPNSFNPYLREKIPLFLSGQGKRITTRAIQNLFKKYFKNI